MIEIKTGLDLPIKGAPRQSIEQAPAVSRIAVLGADYPGMKPTMLVREGERVKLGQPLFSAKKMKVFCLLHRRPAPLLRSIAVSVGSFSRL
jgi:Na+-transporting NADH:ubiquinone oxidoreductase, subunit NqrA